MKLRKAYIELLNGTRKGQEIEVMYNPSEYSMEMSNNYQSTPITGLSTPLIQFSNGSGKSLTLDLFFDTYEKGTDVREHTNQILSLMEIDSELHAPPICRFVWGGDVLKSTIQKVSSKFTMFLPEGTPVRATLNVTFLEYATMTEQLSSKPRRSADKTRVVITKQGDMLWRIAHQYYGNPALWRPIAVTNNIDDPLNIQPGVKLILPSLTDGKQSEVYFGIKEQQL